MSKNGKKYAFLGLGVLLISLIFLSLNSLGGNTINIIGSFQSEDENSDKDQPEEAIEEEGDRSPLNGLVCDNAFRRPIAVTLAGDAEARNLSGLSEADLVIEMPVVTGGITRYLAFFGCNEPEEIGSIRSARHDFVPLAMGFDAMMAHWGGSHFALDKLNSGVMDNINALYLEGIVFYRKPGTVAPHNGFTNYKKLKEYAEKAGYEMEGSFAGYKFLDGDTPSALKGQLTIGYPSIFEVEYEYDGKTNEYRRFKNGSREMDDNNSEQIAAKDVIVMFAASRQIEGQYNDMDIEGEGKAKYYLNGGEIYGSWKKDAGNQSSKLYFYNEAGDEMEFVPGQIWIQIVQSNQEVHWTVGF
ncbi:MAG: DUF3048 domain-containing protein [Candidatus Pacebacteria bacterium]|nr:DUF3048 domain-containing protein [Candidatus Paceibacterota bacterium]